jgi:hypothetical protein
MVQQAAATQSSYSFLHYPPARHSQPIHVPRTPLPAPQLYKLSKGAPVLPVAPCAHKCSSRTSEPRPSAPVGLPQGMLRSQRCLIWQDRLQRSPTNSGLGPRLASAISGTAAWPSATPARGRQGTRTPPGPCPTPLQSVKQRSFWEFRAVFRHRLHPTDMNTQDGSPCVQENRSPCVHENGFDILKMAFEDLMFWLFLMFCFIKKHSICP